VNTPLISHYNFGGNGWRQFSLQLLVAVITLAGLNCTTKKTEPSQGNESDAVAPLRVTATADDLCRIVLAQRKFIDTSYSRDFKAVTATLLSDGSGYRELFEEDRLKEQYPDASYTANFYLSGNLQTLIYKLYLWNAAGDARHNIFFNHFRTGTRDSLFSKNRTYLKHSRDLLILYCRPNPAANRLIVSTNEFIRCYTMKDGSFFDIECRYPFELLWTGNSAFIYNQRFKNNTERIARSIRYDITTKKQTVLQPDDTLPLMSASATEAGDIIFRYKSIAIDDTSGKQGDSLYFCDSSFKTTAACFITNEENPQFTISPSGKWIYYTDERAVRRIPAQAIRGKTLSLEHVNKFAQVIFPFPMLVDGDDIVAIADGTITQLLPAQNGVK